MRPKVTPTLARAITVEEGQAQPFSVFAKDVRALWPRGGPCWLVVRYADTVIATGAVRVVVG